VIQLRDKKGGHVLGSITPTQLQFLIDQREAESVGATDYHLNRASVEMLMDRSADQVLVAVLYRALGNQAAMEIEWVRS
jgi:hypothetical protein